MMKTLAIVNQKGGCGKTTVSINLASCLALHGRRTLLLDMDPQGHCALGLAVPEDQIEMSIYDVLAASGNKPVDMARVIWQIGKNFDLAPSAVELAALEPRLSGQAGRENKLSKALEPLADQYDYCIIDCPPAVGLLTFNALRAAHTALIPVETGYFSLHGLGKQLETIQVLNNQNNCEIVVKIVPNLYDVRTKLGREMLAELRKRFSAHLFKTHINFNTKLREGASLGQAITEYDPHSVGFRDFDKLAREVVEMLEPTPARLPQLSEIESRVAAAGHADEAEPASVPEPDLLKRAETLTRQARQLLTESAQTVGREPSAQREQPTEKKIEIIYGATRTPDGIRFVAHFPQAKQIALAGDFNNWRPDDTFLDALAQHPGDWHTTLLLDPGRYRYRFVVDGMWQQDPHNDYVESNPYGELNSIVEVQ